MMAFTETWFDHSVSDRGSFVDGFGCPTRLDRDKKATGKEKGGGVCLYVNERWCKTVIVREQLCTPDIEKKRVYFRGDLAERKGIQRTVRSEIRKARESYKHKIEMKFQTGDMRAVWDGIRIMSDMQQNGQHSNRLSPLGVKMTGYLQKI